MKLLERIRRFWRSGQEPDHPLTEEEREREPPTAFDEAAQAVDQTFGVDSERAAEED